MSDELPSLVEDHISPIRALQRLQNVGWQYLTPAEAVSLPGGRLSTVLLETVLVEQLRNQGCGGGGPERIQADGSRIDHLRMSVHGRTNWRRQALCHRHRSPANRAPGTGCVV